ncbi:MAG: DNA mismatch repair endonuclease MutL [Candidatus Aminicenantes bacterium]|nr:DNA mismatch repair endonuclease MutL [Candidatus Aminicenantes bacterium]
MNRIAVLPDSLSRKIAAGEVIERPVSVTKELVENALDAGATAIAVDLVAGGKALLRVRDDGCGMSRADAALALVRHATSKLSREEDLFSIATLGFRGEALASIAAVSRILLRTSEGGGDPGTLVESEPDGKVRVQDAAFPKGTEIEVRDLFHNLPARKKFLRGDSSELGLIVKMLSNIALAHPGLRLTVRHGPRTVLDCPPVGSLRERLYQLYGKDVLEKLMEVDLSDGPFRVSGFASRPPYGRPDRSRQAFFVNRRPVKDKILSAALQQAFSGLLEKGLFPEAFLFVDVPFGEVDVNVHPAKTEVRFRDGQLFFPLVRRAIERARTRVLGVMDLSEIIAGESGLTFGAGTGRDEAGDTAAGPAAVPGGKARVPFQVGERNEPYASWPNVAEPPLPGNIPGPAESPRVLGQFGFAYILAEDAGDLLIIDQHNAHERVIYDRYLEIDREKKWPVKLSLIPLVFELSPAQTIGLEAADPALCSSGFRIEPMGGRSYALREYPDVFQPEEALAVVLAAVDESKRGAVTPAKDRLLATMACKSAVKAGESLPREKMEFLVRELFRTSNPGVCPHGRPIIVRIPRSQIERGIRRPVSDPKS